MAVRLLELSPTGTIGTASNWHFVSKTSEVAGEVGTQFGIEFRLEGNPVDDTVTLHMVLKFPRQGIRNPHTGATMHTADITFPDLKIGALCLLGYGFDNAWEIVPGVWTEQIWYQDRMLAERTFTVSSRKAAIDFAGSGTTGRTISPPLSCTASSANSDRSLAEKHANASRAEFGFLEAVRVRHCHDTIGKVRSFVMQCTILWGFDRRVGFDIAVAASRVAFAAPNVGSYIGVRLER
jgi:hypothetical protein